MTKLLAKAIVRKLKKEYAKKNAELRKIITDVQTCVTAASIEGAAIPRPIKSAWLEKLNEAAHTLLLAFYPTYKSELVNLNFFPQYVFDHPIFLVVLLGLKEDFLKSVSLEDRLLAEKIITFYQEKIQKRDAPARLPEALRGAIRDEQDRVLFGLSNGASDSAFLSALYGALCSCPHVIPVYVDINHYQARVSSDPAQTLATQQPFVRDFLRATPASYLMSRQEIDPRAWIRKYREESLRDLLEGSRTSEGSILTTAVYHANQSAIEALLDEKGVVSFVDIVETLLYFLREDPNSVGFNLFLDILLERDKSDQITAALYVLRLSATQAVAIPTRLQYYGEQVLSFASLNEAEILALREGMLECARLREELRNAAEEQLLTYATNSVYLRLEAAEQERIAGLLMDPVVLSLLHSRFPEVNICEECISVDRKTAAFERNKSRINSAMQVCLDEKTPQMLFVEIPRDEAGLPVQALVLFLREPNERKATIYFVSTEKREQYDFSQRLPLSDRAPSAKFLSLIRPALHEAGLFSSVLKLQFERPEQGSDLEALIKKAEAILAGHCLAVTGVQEVASDTAVPVATHSPSPPGAAESPQASPVRAVSAEPSAVAVTVVPQQTEVPVSIVAVSSALAAASASSLTESVAIASSASSSAVLEEVADPTERMVDSESLIALLNQKFPLEGPVMVFGSHSMSEEERETREAAFQRAMNLCLIEKRSSIIALNFKEAATGRAHWVLAFFMPALEGQKYPVIHYVDAAGGGAQREYNLSQEIARYSFVGKQAQRERAFFATLRHTIIGQDCLSGFETSPRIFTDYRNNQGSQTDCGNRLVDNAVALYEDLKNRLPKPQVQVARKAAKTSAASSSSASSSSPAPKKPEPQKVVPPKPKASSQKAAAAPSQDWKKALEAAIRQRDFQKIVDLCLEHHKKDAKEAIQFALDFSDAYQREVLWKAFLFKKVADDQDQGLLHHAATQGRLDIFQALFPERKADVAATTPPSAKKQGGKKQGKKAVKPSDDVDFLGQEIVSKSTDLNVLEQKDKLGCTAFDAALAAKNYALAAYIFARNPKSLEGGNTFQGEDERLLIEQIQNIGLQNADVAFALIASRLNYVRIAQKADHLTRNLDFLKRLHRVLILDWKVPDSAKPFLVELERRLFGLGVPAPTKEKSNPDFRYAEAKFRVDLLSRIDKFLEEDDAQIFLAFLKESMIELTSFCYQDELLLERIVRLGKVKTLDAIRDRKLLPDWVSIRNPIDKGTLFHALARSQGLQQETIVHILAILANQKVSVDTPDNDGKTARQVAIETGNRVVETFEVRQLGEAFSSKLLARFEPVLERVGVQARFSQDERKLLEKFQQALRDLEQGQGESGEVKKAYQTFKLEGDGYPEILRRILGSSNGLSGVASLRNMAVFRMEVINLIKAVYADEAEKKALTPADKKCLFELSGAIERLRRTVLEHSSKFLGQPLELQFLLTAPVAGLVLQGQEKLDRLQQRQPQASAAVFFSAAAAAATCSNAEDRDKEEGVNTKFLRANFFVPENADNSALREYLVSVAEALDMIVSVDFLEMVLRSETSFEQLKQTVLLFWQGYTQSVAQLEADKTSGDDKKNQGIDRFIKAISFLDDGLRRLIFADDAHLVLQRLQLGIYVFDTENFINVFTATTEASTREQARRLFEIPKQLLDWRSRYLSGELPPYVAQDYPLAFCALARFGNLLLSHQDLLSFAERAPFLERLLLSTSSCVHGLERKSLDDTCTIPDRAGPVESGVLYDLLPIAQRSLLGKLEQLPQALLKLAIYLDLIANKPATDFRKMVSVLRPLLEIYIKQGAEFLAFAQQGENALVCQHRKGLLSLFESLVKKIKEFMRAHQSDSVEISNFCTMLERAESLSKTESSLQECVESFRDFLEQARGFLSSLHQSQEVDTVESFVGNSKKELRLLLLGAQELDDDVLVNTIVPLWDEMCEIEKEARSLLAQQDLRPESRQALEKFLAPLPEEIEKPEEKSFTATDRSLLERIKSFNNFLQEMLLKPPKEVTLHQRMLMYVYTRDFISESKLKIHEYSRALVGENESEREGREATVKVYKELFGALLRLSMQDPFLKKAASLQPAVSVAAACAAHSSTFNAGAKTPAASSSSFAAASSSTSSTSEFRAQ